jgi:hypothetical protein
MSNARSPDLRRVLLFALWVLPAPVAAHDVYVDRAMAVFYGHPDSGSEMYPADKVRNIAAWAADGTSLTVTPRHVDGVTRIDPAAPLAVIAVTFDNGLYARTPAAGKFVPGGRDVHADATEVRRFMKYGTTVFGTPVRALEPVGTVLEIVPVAWPAPGADRITVAVRHEGRPLVGVAVIRDGADAEAAATTGADGEASLPWRADQAQLYTTRHETPGTEGVDRIGHAAALYLVPVR